MEKKTNLFLLEILKTTTATTQCVIKCECMCVCVYYDSLAHSFSILTDSHFIQLRTFAFVSQSKSEYFLAIPRVRSRTRSLCRLQSDAWRKTDRQTDNWYNKVLTCFSRFALSFPNKDLFFGPSMPFRLHVSLPLLSFPLSTRKTLPNQVWCSHSHSAIG